MTVLGYIVDGICLLIVLGIVVVVVLFLLAIRDVRRAEWHCEDIPDAGEYVGVDELLTIEEES